jgi:hypothetical protein
MNYIITEKFGPGSKNWDAYAQWAGLERCEAYYSIDGLMRKGLFTPETTEDWDNCVQEDYKLHLITNLDYAKEVFKKFSNAEILGVVRDPRSFNEGILPNHMLVGYDIIDGYNDISLITNWGGKESIDVKLNEAALIEDIDQAYQLKGKLRREYPEEPHASECEVWAVYKLNVG